MSKLKGIVTALPAPLSEDGALRLDVTTRHIEDSIAAGVKGFWVNGATGCCIYLDISKRKEILEAALQVVAGRVPILTMVSCVTLEDGLALAEHARKVGAIGVSALPPLLYPITVKDVIGYLHALKEKADLPMTYYHVAGLTKVQLGSEELCQLCEQVPLEGIKFSDIDFFKAIEIRQRCPDVGIYSGTEETLLGGLAMGCMDGSVGAGQNFMPGPLSELYDAFEHGELETARRLHAGIARIVSVHGMFDFTASTYGILNILGYNFGRPIRPMIGLDKNQMVDLKTALLKVIKPEPIEEGRLIESGDLLF